MAEPALYLASASPRRRELLAQLGLAFAVIEVEVDERARPEEPPAALVRRLAQAKAEAGLAALGAPPGAVVLGADTVVVVGGEALGKPADRAAAEAMLARLAGREHRVLSAVALARPGRPSALAVSATRVWMGPIPAARRRAYCAGGEPLDKAGGYAIQGRAAAFVRRIEGSYSGVVGLPLYQTATLLARAGITVPAGWR